MNFQLSIFNLQSYIKNNKNIVNQSQYEFNVFSRLELFFDRLEIILHTECLALQLELNLAPQGLIDGLRAKAKKDLLAHLNYQSHPPLISCFNLIYQSFNVSPSEIKESAKLFYDIFNNKRSLKSVEDLTVILLTTLKLKIKKSHEDGFFIFEKKPEDLKNKVLFLERIKDDPILNQLLEHPDYPFSIEDKKQLTLNEFEIILNNPIARIFLLAHVKVTELDQPNMERTKLAIRDLTPEQVASLIQLAESTQKNIGIPNFKMLLTNLYSNSSYDLTQLATVFNAANIISNRAPIVLQELLNLVLNESAAVVTKQLPDLYDRAMAEAYVPIPNDEVYRSYLTYSDDILPEFMVDQEALAKAIVHFEAVDAMNKTLFGSDPVRLKSQLDIAVNAYKTGHSLEEKQRNSIVIWAILRESFRQTYHIFLYSTQMINAYLILNAPNQKLIAQIKTGEGKSALFTLMMAYQFLTTGKKQYNVTTASYLAERDVEKFSRFYKMLGISCSINVSSNPNSDKSYGNPKCYEGNIVYGTAESFQFGYLLSLFLNPRGKKLREVINLPMADVFIDEVDALVIDKERSMSKISQPKEASYDTTNLFQDILTYSDETESDDISLNDLRHYLIQSGHFTDITINERNNLRLTDHWFDSMWSSKKIAKDCEYVVIQDQQTNEGKVVIVDRKGTGSLMHGAQWRHGLHQLISAREQVPVEPENVTCASTSQRSFFNLFSSLFALTGTTGGKACDDYLANMYPGIKVLNMPRYRQSKAKMIDHLVSDSKEQQYQQLLTDIQLARQLGQPLLLLFETILETKDFQRYAQSKGFNISVLTGNDNEPVDTILALAGLPGSVLAATFLAGRGADITPSPEAEANGGLGVLVCTPPINERVIWQNFGRTGRQGRQGFYAFRFDKNELIHEMNKLFSSIEHKIDFMQPDQRLLDLQPKPWAEPYQSSEYLNDEIPLLTNLNSNDSLNNPWIMPPNETELYYINKKKQDPISYDVLPNQLLQQWAELRNEAERLSNHVSIKYARYSDLIFEFQQFIYQTKNPALIHELTESYDLLNDDLEDSFNQRSFIAFEKIVGTTLVNMAIKSELSIKSLYVMAEQNEAMVRCLSWVRQPDNTEQLFAESSFTFFSTEDSKKHGINFEPATNSMKKNGI